jgi:hypothetical protein
MMPTLSVSSAEALPDPLLEDQHRETARNRSRNQLAQVGRPGSLVQQSLADEVEKLSELIIRQLDRA